MTKNTRNIIKEKITRINLSKREMFNKILKSIGQNNNVNNNVKIYTNYIINKITKKNFCYSKKHKICIHTGKRSGILKGFNSSRYITKELILRNRFTNLKKNNW